MNRSKRDMLGRTVGRCGLAMAPAARPFLATAAAALLATTLVGSDRVAAAPPPPKNPTLAVPAGPAWPATHRIRFALHVVGKIENSTTKSIIAQLPGGGWFAADAADVMVTTSAGET